MAKRKSREEFYRDQVDIRIARIFLEMLISLSELSAESDDWTFEEGMSCMDETIAELDDYVQMIAARTEDRQLILDYAKAAFGCKMIWSDGLDVLSESFAASQIRQLEPRILDAELDAIMVSHVHLVERLYGRDSMSAEIGMTLTEFKLDSMRSVETLLQATVQDKEKFI